MQQNFDNETGPLPIRLVNDYLFHVLLQENNEVLTALIASLLHLKSDEIQKVEIQNPIELGTVPLDKEFVLDIRILMNDNTLINLEMQVINQHNWPERSIAYLCRLFDNLSSGEDYLEVKPAIQIGLLDYTPFPDSPEFYSTYYLTNQVTHKIYSSKFRLSVLDLTQIELATEEDRFYGIDFLATLFKATTWEELKMIASKSEVMTKAVSAVYNITQDDLARERCRAREEAIAHENYLLRQIAERDKQLDERDKQLNQRDKQIDELTAQIKKLQSQLDKR